MAKRVKFKSTHENWKKEYLGIKSNTARIFTKKDKRKDVLLEYITGNLNMLYVDIENTRTGEVFSRVVTDVTLFEDYIFIISW